MTSFFVNRDFTYTDLFESCGLAVTTVTLLVSIGKVVSNYYFYYIMMSLLLFVVSMAAFDYYRTIKNNRKVLYKEKCDGNRNRSTNEKQRRKNTILTLQTFRRTTSIVCNERRVKKSSVLSRASDTTRIENSYLSVKKVPRWMGRKKYKQSEKTSPTVNPMFVPKRKVTKSDYRVSSMLVRQFHDNLPLV